MKTVILISGKINSGKNHFAKQLTKLYTKEKLIVSSDLFAYGVKKGASEDFQIVENYLNSIALTMREKLQDLENTISKNYHDFKIANTNEPTIIHNLKNLSDLLRIKEQNWYEDKTDLTRKFLQLYGTDIFRNRVDTNFWVKQLKQRLIDSKSDVIFVTDVRFKNEIELIAESHKYKTIAIRIDRNLNEDKTISEHPSETALDDYKYFDYIVENKKSINFFNTSIETTFTEIKKDII